jgi:hypothetical protein
VFPGAKASSAAPVPMTPRVSAQHGLTAPPATQLPAKRPSKRHVAAAQRPWISAGRKCTQAPVRPTTRTDTQRRAAYPHSRSRSANTPTRPRP